MEELKKTICNRDCPDACGIVARVVDGRVTALLGDREHPITQGFLCQRTHKFLERQYAPERVTRPLLRRGGALEPVSWQSALDFAAERLLDIRRHLGGAAIFHYRSGGTLGMLPAAASDRFFELFGPVTVKRGDICSGAGEHAQELDFGVCDSSDLEELARARNVVLWGKNAFVSSPHTLPLLKRARAAGARLTLVDPVHQRSEALCDRYLQPRPGGDFALAMAVGRELFARGLCHPEAERYCEGVAGFRALCEARTTAAWCALADVPESGAVELARALADGPTTILVGWGMGRRRNGGAIVRAIDALGALSGNVGVPGAGVSFYFRRRRAFVSPAAGRHARTLCEPLFGAGIARAANPPIAAVWITAGNPVAMLPDSHATVAALASRELVVVADSFLTDTAALAHLVLPTPTLLETDDLVGAYGHHYLGAARAVVAPPAEVKSDLEIFQALAERLGFGAELAGSARAWQDRMLSPELAAHGVDLERLERGVVKNPLAPGVLFAGRVFPTPSGRARLMTEAPDAARGLAAPDDPHYPLVLMSLSTAASQSSQWSGPRPHPAEVRVHPDAAPGLGDGAEARLVSRTGALVVRVRHNRAQRRDVALVPKGGHLADGACANALIAAALTDLGEGGALYDERVRLEALG